MKPVALHLHSVHPSRNPLRPNVESDLSLYDSDHWDEVAQDVKRECRSTRLKTLYGINQVIYELISSNEKLSTQLNLHNALQMSYGLLDAEVRDYRDMEELERRFINFASTTLKQLQKLEGSGSDKLSRLDAYGGAVGNAIFGMATMGLTVPVLTSFLARFSHQTKDLTTYEHRLEAVTAFLHSFLGLAGKERGRIAEMTATPKFEEFGRFVTTGRLSDPVSRAPGWKPWEAMMIAKIGQVIAPAWNEFCSRGDGDPWNFLPVCGLVDLHKHDMSLQLQGGRDKVGCLFYRGNSNARACFRFEWSPQKDMTPFASPIEITRIVCEHPPRKANHVLGQDFLEVIRWTPDPRQLQDKLASILYDFSHTSTFDRGSASICEMMIEAVAALHGYAVAFSPEWMLPDHPSADMQALSEFNRDSFIEAARTHMLLSKLDKDRRVSNNLL